MRSITRTAALAAALSLTQVAAISQESGSSPQAAPTAVEENVHFRMLDLDFPGGKISALLEQLEEAVGDKPNVLVDERSAELEIPRLSLRSVTIPEVILAVSQLHPSLRADVGRSRSIITLTYSQPNIVARGFNPEQRSIQLFNVSRYLEKFAIADIVTAIETAWEMLGDGEGAEVRYHEETMLLIAAGNQRQLQAIHAVLSELQSSLPPMLGAPSTGSRWTTQVATPENVEEEEAPAADEGHEGGASEEETPEPAAPGRRRSR